MLAITHCPTCDVTLEEESGVCPRCGSTYCPECGSPLAGNEDKCGSCGAEFGSFCSDCEQEVPADAVVCPHCAALLVETGVPSADESQLGTIKLVLPAQHSGKCPSCDAPVYLEDGFCSQCGLSLCASCGKAVDEEDEICPHCQTPLFFDCPLCGFELVTGSDQCPNCNALIPNYCTHCRAELAGDMQQCPKCTVPIKITRRKGARIIHSLRLGEQIVQVAACPGCGGRIHVHEGLCRSCGYRICSECQIGLEPDEIVCPRCGPEKPRITYAPEQGRTCKNCGHPLQAQEDECPHCGQLFCPECLTPMGDDDFVCTKCGAEFDLACPQCGQVVATSDQNCANCGLKF